MIVIKLEGIKWWSLIPAANDPTGGDGKRAVAQQYFWWPSSINPEG